MLDLSKITDLVIQTASHTQYLTDAIFIVQRAAGLTTGDIAGAFFSGANGDEWASAVPARRAEIVRAYVERERDFLPEKIVYLTVEAWDLTEEFIAEIKADYGVIVHDDSDAPHSVVFKGAHEKLVEMYLAFWSSDEGEEPDAQWFSEDPPLQCAVSTLSAEFSRLIRAWLSAAQLEAVRKGLAEIDDYCDSNEAMVQAWAIAVPSVAYDPANPSHAAAIGAAWAKSIENGYA